MSMNLPLNSNTCWDFILDSLWPSKLAEQSVPNKPTAFGSNSSRYEREYHKKYMVYFVGNFRDIGYMQEREPTTIIRISG